MSNLKYAQFQFLKKMGREPIDLPAEINFGGNETLQRTPGNHHLPEFRETGTYWHPQIVAQRLRVAQDRLDRAMNQKASEPELAKSGGGDIETMERKVKQCQDELLMVLSGKHEQAKAMFKKDEPTKTETFTMKVVTETVAEDVSPVEVKVEAEPVEKLAKPAKRGRPAKIEAEPVSKNDNVVRAAQIAAKAPGMNDLKSDSDED